MPLLGEPAWSVDVASKGIGPAAEEAAGDAIGEAASLFAEACCVKDASLAAATVLCWQFSISSSARRIGCVVFQHFADPMSGGERPCSADPACPRTFPVSLGHGKLLDVALKR